MKVYKECTKCYEKLSLNTRICPACGFMFRHYGSKRRNVPYTNLTNQYIDITAKEVTTAYIHDIQKIKLQSLLSKKMNTNKSLSSGRKCGKSMFLCKTQFESVNSEISLNISLVMNKGIVQFQKRVKEGPDFICTCCHRMMYKKCMQLFKSSTAYFN